MTKKMDVKQIQIEKLKSEIADLKDALHTMIEINEQVHSQNEQLKNRIEAMKK